MLDLTRPQSTMLDHGHLAFDALAPTDRPFSLDGPQSTARSIDWHSAARMAYSHLFSNYSAICLHTLYLDGYTVKDAGSCS